MITEFKEYLYPKTVSIPLTDSLFKIASVKVEVNDEVKVGQVLGVKYYGKQKMPVLSSVSGVVKGFEMMEDRYGKKVDHCVIENNMDDDALTLPSYVVSETAASELRNAIADCGLEYVNVDGIYTPLLFEKEINHLVVNTVFMLEPFYSVDYEKVLFIDSLVKGIEVLQKASLAKQVTVLYDRNLDKELFVELQTRAGELGVKLVAMNPSKVNGADVVAIKKLVKKDLKPNLLDSGVMYVKSDTIYALDKAICNGTYPSTRQVIVTGDGIKENAVIEVLNGTPLKELVEELGGYNEVEEMVVHVGDFLTGNQVTTDQFVITQTVDAVNVSEYAPVVEDVCTKCGDCNDVCPVGILPQNIMDAELRSVSERIKALQTNLCIECGLCSYVCPSKINVLEWVRRAKRRVG